MSAASLSTAHHPRLSPYGQYIYPVLSRRSGGLSLGVNLNLDKHCSFNCRYCQVERAEPLPIHRPDEAQILAEVESFLKGGHEFESRELKDIALAGDGEPTEAACLGPVIEGLMDLKERYGLAQTKVILNTNGTGLAKKSLLPSLRRLTGEGGEIWFKLDFWDESSYHEINRGKISFQNLLKHLKQVGTEVPITLQSCFFDGAKPFGPEQTQAYVKLVQGFLDQGILISQILAYTLARPPAEMECKAIGKERMEEIGQQLNKALPLKISEYYSS